MAAIQQWWLGMNRKRNTEPTPPAGAMSLANWVLGWGVLDAYYDPPEIGTLSNDLDAFEIAVDEYHLQRALPGYATAISTDTTPLPDTVVLSNTNGQKIRMECGFMLEAPLAPGDRPVEFTVNGDLYIIGAEGTGSAMPGQIVFSCGQNAGGGDGPNWLPEVGVDYRIALEWDADEGASGTARWFIDGEEWGASSTIGEITVKDDVPVDTVSWTSNVGLLEYAWLRTMPGPGLVPVDWQASNTGTMSSTPACTNDFDDGGETALVYSGSRWQGEYNDNDLPHTDFSNSESLIPYSQRAGFPSGGAELTMVCDLSGDYHSRGDIRCFDVNNDGWSLNIENDPFGGDTDRRVSGTVWNGGSGSGFLNYEFSGTGNHTLRMVVGPTEATLYHNGTPVATEAHGIPNGANFMSGVTRVTMNVATNFGSDPEDSGPQHPEKMLFVSARIRDVTP